MKLLLVLALVALATGATADDAETSSRAGGMDRSYPDLLKRNEVLVRTLKDVYNSLSQFITLQVDPKVRNFSFLTKFYFVYGTLPTPKLQDPYPLQFSEALNVTVAKYTHQNVYYNAATALLYLDELRVRTRKRSAAVQRLCYDTTKNQVCEDRLKDFDKNEVAHCVEHAKHEELHSFVLENVYYLEKFADDLLNSKKVSFEQLPSYLQDLRDRPRQKEVVTTLLPKLKEKFLSDPNSCPFGHYSRDVYLQ